MRCFKCGEITDEDELLPLQYGNRDFHCECVDCMRAGVREIQDRLYDVSDWANLEAYDRARILVVFENEEMFR